MFPAPRMAFSHIGLYVTDMDSMLAFYTSVLGFCVTDRAHIRGVDVVFISRNPEEHHQIVLVPGRARGSASTLNQVSFRVPSLTELRRVHAELAALQVKGLNPTNHGGSWSVYFMDPEGNRIELLTQTPWYMPPVSLPLDLERSDEQIFLDTKAMVASTAGSMDRVEWSARLREKLQAQGSMEHRAPILPPEL